MQGSRYLNLNSMTTFEKNFVFSCQINTKHQDQLDTLSRNNVKVKGKKIICYM